MKKIYPIDLDILIVEDEKVLAEVYKVELEKCGHRVQTVSNFYQACNILRSANKFHLVITDMTMQSLPFTEVVGSIAGLVESYQSDAKVLILSARPVGEMRLYKDLFDLAGYIDRSMHFEEDVQEILSKIETLFPTK